MAFNVKAVMFDLDGTLIDTAPEIAFAVNSMLADMGKSTLSADQIRTYIGEGAQMLIRRAISGGEPQFDDALFERAQALFFKHYADNVANSRVFPGVVDGLQMLKDKGLRLACVTNKPERFTRPVLKANGLDQFFELVVSGDTLSGKKPDPIQLLHICAEFKVLEAQAMLVGDSMIDIRAAHAAGCYIVTVPYGYNQGRPIDESQVDAVIENMTELASLLD